MQVLKFGGTSVGSAERMQHVAQLIQGGSPKIVVLSAVSGTTNKLAELSGALQLGLPALASERLAALEAEYEILIKDLLPNAYLSQASMILDRQFSEIRTLVAAPFEQTTEKILLAQGELISTQLFHLYLETKQVKAKLLPALDFMRINEDQEPDLTYISERLNLLLEAYQNENILITQGYICRNTQGQIDNLQRGGSDYTATLIGAAIAAEEIQIWTDIDGLHNNDPRVVKDTSPVRRVSYREAAELAYFGAKILHPTCVIPAEAENVPIRLKNTFAPNAAGTLISEQGSGQRLSAIAAKDGITALKIRSGRMLNAYGFLRKVFEVFEVYRTPIDMITTSEVSVSLTIDNNENLEAILKDLRAFGEVSVDEAHTIICIVGDALNEHKGYTKTIFAALAEVPIRMVSYGGSNNNISILIPKEYKNQALLNLHEKLFSTVAEYQK
jgi:aspartate kinase